MKYFAVIVAGGSGKRMDNAIPKQFLLLNGRPLLYYTLLAFFNCPLKPEIVLVLNPAQRAEWAALCTRYKINIPHAVVNGGAERYHSVKNALDAILEDSIIAIHDAVRPLVSTELISTIFKEAEEKGNAVAAINPGESVRYRRRPINRDEVLLVQTPQAFDSKLIKDAYLQPFNTNFTDDATVAETNGILINLVEGERTNIKVTWPSDLVVAESYLGNA